MAGKNPWPLAPAIQPSSVYNFADLDDLDSYYSGNRGGFLYARDGHPNASDLASRLARAHRADWACVTSSGMAALAAVFLSRLGPGRHLVASRWLYGKSRQLICDFETRGTRVTWFNPDGSDSLKLSLGKGADLVLVESITNPLVRVADLEAMASACTLTGTPLAVDNTFPTAVFLKPLVVGADIVIESLTKLVNGHGDATLGLIAAKNEWKQSIAPLVSLYGFNSSPFDCWLTGRGAETLEIRAVAACSNAGKLARALVGHPGVISVHHPSLPTHSDHELASRLMPAGTCNIVSFEIEGGREGANSFFKRCRAFTLSPSLGHTETTLSYPAGTSHRGLTPEEREWEGIGPGLIRVSVGIESFDAIKEGIVQGLSGQSR